MAEQSGENTIRVLHLFDLYLPGTMNWAWQLLQHTPQAEHWIAAPWLVQNQFYVSDFQYIENPLQRFFGFRPCHERQYIRRRRLLLFLEKRWPLYQKRLFKKIKTIRPQVLHAHFGPVACQYLGLAEKTGIPLVVSFYGYDYEKVPYRQPEFLTKYRRLFEIAAAIVVLGPQGRRILETYGCPPEKIREIPLGILPERFSDAARAKTPGRLQLLQLATFTEKKGYRVTLEAFRQALQDCPNLHLTLAGEQFDRALVLDLQAFIRDHHLSKHITWLDYLEPEQVPDLLDQFDVFIHPSHYTADRDCEGAPVVILEAMAAGLPVIATRHVDIPAQVPEGKAGILCPEKDVTALAEAIRVFYRIDDTAYRQFSQAARQQALEHFDVRGCAAKLSRAYGSARQAGGPSARRGAKLRLLILAAWYSPLSHPRAHRWTALAEHWALLGHEVHVVAARQPGAVRAALENGVRVHRAGFDSLKSMFGYDGAGKGQAPPGRGMRLLMWGYRLFWQNLYFPDDACVWYFPAKRKMLQLLEQEPFDAVVSVSLPFTGHLLGRLAKRLYPRLRWLADVGDPFSLQKPALNNAFFYGAWSRRLEKNILIEADAASVTTSATLRLFGQQFGAEAVARLRVIPPLLHPLPDHKVSHPEDSSKIRIGYFGSFYRGLRTPEALLDLLDQTAALQPDLFARVEVQVWGALQPDVLRRLRGHSAIRLHGLRPRAIVRDAMQEMDILLSVGNRSTAQLPSKAVEYLASGKPVLHLSYVDEDPWLAFWGNQPGLLCLNVKEGKVEMEGVQRWMSFLTDEKKNFSAAERQNQIEKFTIAAVSKEYEELIWAESPN